MALYTYEKQVNPKRLHSEISAELPGFQCIETIGNSLNIHFSSELSSEDETILNDLVQDHQVVVLQDIVTNSLHNAVTEGLSIIEEFKNRNVMTGITQAGKTKAVSDFCHRLEHYLAQGSLYAAIEQINILINDGLDPALSPFVTETVLNEYKERLQDYLGI